MITISHIALVLLLHLSLLSDTAWVDEISGEFDRACDDGFIRSMGMCSPDLQRILSALDSADSAPESDEFQGVLQTLVEQLLKLPAAWPSLPAVLNPHKPWTMTYCDVVIGETEWSVFDFLRMPEATTLLYKNTLEEMHQMKPSAAAAIERWLGKLGAGKDKKLQTLAKSVQMANQNATSVGFLRKRAWEDLLQHLQAKHVHHILGKACSDSRPAVRRVLMSDSQGRTALHHMAMRGNTPVIKVFIKTMQESAKDAVRSYVQMTDAAGYTAEQLAISSSYNDTAAVFRRYKTPTCATCGYIDPEAMRFANSRSGKSNQSSKGTCSTKSSEGTCSSSNTGGWDHSGAHSGALDAWMPPPKEPCFVDAIDSSQFKWDKFSNHYVRYGRPLLIRGAAQMSTSRLLARDFLSGIAGQRVFNIFEIPYADKHLANQTSATMNLSEYLTYLDERREGDPSQKLRYLFESVGSDDPTLNFTHRLPRILQGKVQRLSTQFSVGGVLMGAPFHYHPAATNTLFYGRKLWFLASPADGGWSNEAPYRSLLRVGVYPGARRCVQEAGDILFVPESWSHATICLTDCVSVSHEFSL